MKILFSIEFRNFEFFDLLNKLVSLADDLLELFLELFIVSRVTGNQKFFYFLDITGIIPRFDYCCLLLGVLNDEAHFCDFHIEVIDSFSMHVQFIFQKDDSLNLVLDLTILSSKLLNQYFVIFLKFEDSFFKNFNSLVVFRLNNNIMNDVVPFDHFGFLSDHRLIVGESIVGFWMGVKFWNHFEIGRLNWFISSAHSGYLGKVLRFSDCVLDFDFSLEFHVRDRFFGIDNSLVDQTELMV